jgi:hypothetical protein
MPSTVIKIGALGLVDQVIVDPSLIQGVVPAMDPAESPGPRDVTAGDERGVSVLAGAISYMAPEEGERQPLRGDVNADGEVQVADAIALALVLLEGGALPSSFAAADVDRSARVDISDAIAILVHLHLGPPPAAAR